MEFFIGLIKFFVIAFNAIACILGFVTVVYTIVLLSEPKKEGFKDGVYFGCVCLFICVLFGLGGYFCREYSMTLVQRKEYANSLNIMKSYLETGTEDNRDQIRLCFYHLSKDDWNEYIDDIYDKFYDHDIKGEYEFICDYGGMSYLEFVRDITESLVKKMEQMYVEAECSSEPEVWKTFSDLFSSEFFNKYASKKLKEKEFSKWDSDDSAWQRVLQMYHVDFSSEYLSRYPNGIHVENAKKFILDHDYESREKKPPYKIINNYNGHTTLYIHNSTRESIIVSYSGTFASDKFYVDAQGFKYVSVPNGYYTISAQSAHTLSVISSYSLETLDGGEKSFDIYITQR